MQQHRIISLLSIVIMLIIPVIGWFLIAQPQLAAAGSADQQRSDVDSKIAESAAIVAQLKADSAQLPVLNDDLNDLRTSIPADVDSDGYIDGLNALAQLAGVSITSLTVDQPLKYVQATPPVDPNAVASDATASDDADSDAPSTPPPPPADPAIVTSPLITSDTFVAIPVTIGVTGDWTTILRFVDGLQSSPRLFLVTALNTAVVEGAPDSMTGNIGGFIYAIPTGAEGKPRPISTTVKQLTAPVVVDEATDGDTADGADGDATGDDTDTQAP